MCNHNVEILCSACGRQHRVTGGLILHGSPTQPGTLAELYGDGELPLALASLLNDLVECPVTQQWVQQTDRHHVFLDPCNQEIP
jgi:hypothetical protein